MSITDPRAPEPLPAIAAEIRAELARLERVQSAAISAFVAADELYGPGSVIWTEAQARMADAGERLGAFAASHMAALLAALSAAEAERDKAREAGVSLWNALNDMRAGWRYIRKHHGDLAGVGWDRCEASSTEALAAARSALAPASDCAAEGERR